MVFGLYARKKCFVYKRFALSTLIIVFLNDNGTLQKQVCVHFFITMPVYYCRKLCTKVKKYKR